MNEQLKKEHIGDLLYLGYTEAEAEEQYNQELMILGEIGSSDMPLFTILDSEFDEWE